ncbi:hypothetical protein [Spirosoma luteum]|uniref:hypothetical protein n=1 Tax=Spirosoma luteum TaxID=431553 RepID=UPI0003738ECC|nr:hypothetical protein [Spirosoma luteum]
MLRCLLASLLLINYLLVVGLGCISRPEDQQEFVLVQTSEAGKQYQECRYMRMDGLENFLLESLASRYQKATDTPKHHIISTVSGIDSHYLPCTQWLTHEPVYKDTIKPLSSGQYTIPPGYGWPMQLPPRLA